MSYCTVAEAQAAGAVGTNDEITAAIEAATELITAYTGELFETTETTVTISALGGGLLPYRVQSITAARAVGSDTDLDSTSYRVTSSSVVGDLDTIEVIGGGYFSAGHPYRISVTGTFGYETTPKAVTRACALIAAHLTKHPTGYSEAGVRSLAVEGYRVDYGDTTNRATTGVAEADMLLAPYRKVVLA